MTDAERLEKWYAEQNFLPGVKSIFKNVYGNYYVQDVTGKPPVPTLNP